MKYQSTRGSPKRLSFEEVLVNAYAEDGGLYLPENIPQVSSEDLKAWSSLSYVELCKAIVCLYVDEVGYKSLNLNDLLEEAFSSFDCPEIIPVEKFPNFCVAELWHGRSLAFKDLAVSCVSRFTENYFKKIKRHANIICATSGDTGSSIMESIKGSKFIDVFTLFPEGRCTEIQERQMCCIPDGNIHAICAEGTSDDFDIVMENIFADQQFSADNSVISFSSMNWVRIMVQIVHYFYSYFQSISEVGDLVSVVVPSGGLGNLTAGYIAHLMGLPIKLVAAVNQNDSVHRIISKGDFSEPSEVLKSSSCSMDIVVPINIERIIYLASGRDSKALSNLMNEFKENKRVLIPDNVLQKIREVVQSASVSESRVREAINKTWKSHKYHIDPHTAVAMAVILHPERYDVKFSGKKIVCLSCASPQKFPETFKEEGIPFTISRTIEELLKKPRRFEHFKKGENWVEELKKRIVAASENAKNGEMI